MKTTSKSSLTDLFTNPDPPVDHAALVMARDAYPHLDVGSYLARLDEMARPLAQRVRLGMSPTDQAAVLGTFLFDEQGFKGDEETYYDPRNSYLNDVIDRRQGIPLSLAMVLIALGRRAGLTVEGVGFPGHFLLRVGGSAGVYVDPFFHANVLSRENLEALAKRALGDKGRLSPEHLAPVGTRAMVVRMLSNLKNTFESQRDHARALLACDRLVDLGAGPEPLRDRGLHALALGAFAQAVADLDAYLAQRADAPDARSVRAAVEQARGRGGRAMLQ